MIKIRIPHKEISTFKTFCKVFSLHLEDHTGTRLRGNLLLNLMARAAGHDSYTALIIDAKTYGNGKMSWEALPHQLCENVASATGVSQTDCLSSLCFALVDGPSKIDQQGLAPIVRNGNRYFFDRAKDLLSSVMPALGDLSSVGKITISKELIVEFTQYEAFCELFKRSDVSDTSKLALKMYIQSFGEFDSDKPIDQQEALVKSWGYNQGFLNQVLQETPYVEMAH